MVRGQFSQLIAPGVRAIFDKMLRDYGVTEAQFMDLLANSPLQGIDADLIQALKQAGATPEQIEEVRKVQPITKEVVTNPLKIAPPSMCQDGINGGWHCINPAEWVIEKIVNGTAKRYLACNAHVTTMKNLFGHSTVRSFVAPKSIEVEYIELTRKWLGATGSDFVIRLFSWIRDNHGAIQYLPETNSYLIVDDRMSDEEVDTLVEKLEGHPVSKRKIKVLTGETR